MSWYLYKRIIKKRRDKEEHAVLFQYQAERINAVVADTMLRLKWAGSGKCIKLRKHLVRYLGSGWVGYNWKRQQPDILWHFMPADTNVSLKFEIFFSFTLNSSITLGIQMLHTDYLCCHCDSAFYICDSAIPGKAQPVVTRKTNSEK